MTGPALVAVAHGSRNPVAQETTRALARQVTRLAPHLDVRVTFLQHGEMSLAAGLAAAGAGSVVVPLLLSAGYHVTADITAAAQAAGAVAAPPLGPDQLLATALAVRLAEAGVPAGTPVVLAAAGSSDRQAAQDVARQAELLSAELGVPVRPAFATAAEPSVESAVDALQAQSGGPVAIAAYLMAPGDFHDRLQKTAAGWITAPLADHPAVAGLVVDRYRVAAKAA
ncbi:MAG: sirohydrochlorin chelatase [Streptosporangiaceae bacterium]